MEAVHCPCSFQGFVFGNRCQARSLREINDTLQQSGDQHHEPFLPEVPQHRALAHRGILLEANTHKHHARIYQKSLGTTQGKEEGLVH